MIAFELHSSTGYDFLSSIQISYLCICKDILLFLFFGLFLIIFIKLMGLMIVSSGI